MVNHWGTIILAEPLELPDDGRRYIDEDTDWDYSPLEGEGTADHEPCTTISTFYGCLRPPKTVLKMPYGQSCIKISGFQAISSCKIQS